MALLEVHVGRVEMLGQTGINLIALLEVHVGREEEARPDRY